MKMHQDLLAVLCVVFLHHAADISGKGNTVVNLALQKRAVQSSDFVRQDGSHYDAGLAVDGGVNNNFDSGTCTHTEGLSNLTVEWWEVDLENEYRIDEIKVLNRAYGAERLHDFRIDVYVNERRPRGGTYCTTHFGKVGPNWSKITCDSRVTGRYVRITKPKLNTEDVLTLCEVEIYGQPERKEREKRSMCFKKDSKMAAFSQGQMFMSRSPLHCASTCGGTPGCKGFIVTSKEDGQVRCNVTMECLDKGGNSEMNDGSLFYHLCW